MEVFAGCWRDSSWMRARCSRAGCAMAAIGDRVFVFGGAALDDGAPLDDLVVLDLEDAAGREQRETVEFHERLERERVRRDAEDAREAKRVSYVRCRIKISRQFLH